MLYRGLVIGLAIGCSTASAGDVSIRQAEFSKIEGADWDVQVTLKHSDSGWEHYADAWRVVDGQGKVLGTRTLLHPHVDEQPFTRSLSGLAIPDEVTEVYIEAHDKVHGWTKDRVRVDLKQRVGDRFRVSR